MTQGDWVEVSVRNDMEFDATTLHWHGMLTVLTPFSDGVPGATQCQIMPGATMEYGFRASNVGTFWYHGHMREQYTDGLYGALLVKDRPTDTSTIPHYDQDITLM